MNRANKLNVALHLLLTVALLGLASLVIAQNNNARAPRRILPTVNKKSQGRKAAHTFIGKVAKLPAWVTRRHLSDKLTRMAHTWHAKGTRAVGDQGVVRQTILLTKAVPSANFSLQSAPSIDLHPYWDASEQYIYFDSDRQAATNTAGGAPFNIYRLLTDGSAVEQITTGSDNKIEPNVSTAGTTSGNLICYVAGGQITIPPPGTAEVPGQPATKIQTSGFNLFVLDLNGNSGPQQLTNLAAPFRFSDVRHPSFAPGGTDICFAGKLQGDPNNVYHIFTVNLAQGNITQYTAGASNDYAPAWSPSVNFPLGATVIAYATNAQSVTPTSAPVISAAINPDGHDDIFVFQPNPQLPSARRVTNFTAPPGPANPNDPSVPHASNRNPAWSTTRLDNRPTGVPPGQTGNGSPTNQAQILLAFASTRVDNNLNSNGEPDSIPNGIAGNHTTDIYYMNATIAADPRDARVVTVTTPETSYAPGATYPNYTGAHKLQTYNPQVAVDALDKPGLTQFDNLHQSSEDYPTFPQFINTYRIAFQSDRGGNYDLWAASILDLDAPTLLQYDPSTNEIVRVERAGDGTSLTNSNRYVAAGTRVRFKIRAVDYQSGIRYAYLQIKCPDSAGQSYDQAEHKIFYNGFSLTAPFPLGLGLIDTTPINVVDSPYEFDSQAIKASDTSGGHATFRPPGGANAPSYLGGPTSIPALWPGFNRYTPNVDDFNAYSGNLNPPDDSTIVPPTPPQFPDGDNGYWLRLQDDGTNTGTFVAEWDTPSNFASDMILDVILYDNAVYPFDSSGATQSNWKIYDNVWGFTTRPFNSTGQILYVSDYDTGQKFFSSRFGTGDFQGITNTAQLSFEGNPTESWMTEMDPQLFPQTAFAPGPTFYQVINFLTPLGATSYGSGNFTFDPTTGATNISGPITGQYDIWRVQCRGTVPISVLNSYGARKVPQPADPVGGNPARSVVVADKCVIWHAPYLGDLYVGPGTLLDSDTQTNLTGFVNSGGRLFVNGQDVGFGLTLGGSQPNAFMSGILHATYTADDAVGPFANDQLNSPGDAFAGAGRGVHPIGWETWYDFPHQYPSVNGEEPPFMVPPVYLSYTTFPRNRDYSCPNTGAEDGTNFDIGSPDLVTFLPPTTLPAVPPNPARAPSATLFPGVFGVDAVYSSTATPLANAAIMWSKDVNSQSKVVFSPFGWETINPEYYIIPGTTTIVLKNRRVELMHNALDYLRTGRLVGQFRVRNGTGGPAQPIPGALIRAYRPDPVSGQVTAATTFTAITKSDGSYIIEGLDADGVYALDGIKSGFLTEHRFGNVFHGGYQATTDLFLTQAQPGNITGTVTAFGTNLPVPSANVQAVDTTNPAAVFTATTDAMGNYTIKNLPGNATYTVTVTNITQLGFNGSIPPSRTVTVGSNQTVGKVDFQLTQPPGFVTGHVLINGTMTGIPGATITAVGANGIATTDANGLYGPVSLTPGSYQLIASAPGFAASGAVPITIVTNQTVTVNFTLVALPPGSISGLVTTSPPNVIPVPGATITVTTSAGQTFTTTTTGVQTNTSNGTNYQYNYQIGNIPAGTTVQVSASKSGYTPKPNPNTQTVPVTTGADTRNVNFILDPLASFNSDLTLVSSPFQYPGVSITDLFSIPGSDLNGSFAFIAWDATQQKYVYRPTPPADTFHLGVGYFLQETNTASILALTNPNYQEAPKDALGNYQPFSIPLQNGWNLIGMPFATSVDFSKLQIQESTGQLVNVPDAQGGGNPSLGGALFTYEHGSYEIVFTLDPFRGYWLRAFRPVTLIITPGAQQGRAVSGKSRAIASNVSGDGWKLQLNARATDTAASKAYLGVASKATDGYDTYKVEAPPAATKENVQIAFEHTDWGSKSAAYSMDVRSASAASWEFTVTSNVLNTPVVVSWPNIATISRHQDMQITDLQSQQSFTLRNRSSMTIPASSGVISHHYRLDVKRATRNPLSLTNLAIVQAGTGRAAGAPVSISYQLSRAASVTIRVMQNGRSIRNVTATGTRDAGANQATWDLKTDNGTSVPANVYTVEVRAADEEGHVVRQVGSVVITR